MNRRRIFSKSSFVAALALVVIFGLGAWLLLKNSWRGDADSSSGHTRHATEEHQPSTAATDSPIPQAPGMAGAAAHAHGETKEKTASPKIIFYRSTMMPNEVSQTPRKDSMGMDMAPVYETEGSTLELSDHARAMASVETVPVERRRLSREIRAAGKVQVNETGLADINVRVEGYVERLFVDFTGVDVKQGDHLVEIYSPDLVVAQKEMLIALERSRDSSLVESTARKLLRWGLTQEQVDELIRTKKVHERLTLYSPIKGTVMEKLVVQKSAVKPGDVLFRLANLESVWVSLDIYEYELPWVRYGQNVEVVSEAVPGQSFKGRVWFISPVLNEETRTVKVLLNINNAGQMLKPGMFASAILRAELLADGKPAPTGVEGRWTCPMHPLVLQPRAGQCPKCAMTLVRIPGAAESGRPVDGQLPLAVPVTAVLDSGVRKLVYVEKSKGQFAPVEIVTGPRADDAYPVLSGLNEGDRVVTRGNFLLDSQLQIRGLPSLFHKEGQAAISGHQHGEASPPAKSGSKASAKGMEPEQPSHGSPVRNHSGHAH